MSPLRNFRGPGDAPIDEASREPLKPLFCVLGASSKIFAIGFMNFRVLGGWGMGVRFFRLEVLLEDFDYTLLGLIDMFWRPAAAMAKVSLPFSFQE